MSNFLRRLGKARYKGTPTDYLVVGLGNPGAEFTQTRHNIGAHVVDLLCQRYDLRLKKTKARALAAGVVLDDKRVIFAFPQTFMNRSGEAVRLLARSYGVQESRDVLILHDELDLDTGRLRLKAGGGNAGHNGLKSVSQHLGTNDYLRLRIGVGRPPASQGGKSYVLRKLTKADQLVLDSAAEEAADAVELVVADGIDVAMGSVNRRRPAK